MADALSAILFIIGLRRAGMENWVKYAILHVPMLLYLCLCASENQALIPFVIWHILLTVNQIFMFE